ncbi:MAG: hypothetical protein MPL62_04185 [Alphaproteobacteria bacterium]|nr:hypothetical protein [Alphaproteobacteria bacterium]
MSEFEARGYAGDGEVIGDHLDSFERFRLGSTTLEELRRRGVVSYQNEAHNNLRPCELFFVHDSVVAKRSNVILTGVVERAPAGGFGTARQHSRAVEHCNSICHAIGADFGVVTGDDEAFWFDSRDRDHENTHRDEATNERIGYTRIRDDDGNPISTPYGIGDSFTISTNSPVAATLGIATHILNSFRRS